MLSILSYHDSTKLPQESAKISGLRWAWYLLGCARKHGRKLVPFFSFPAALTVRSSDRAATVRSRIIYRYLIYLCDRPRCQSIRRGNRLETGRGGEERLVIDFPDVEREFCLPGKSFPLLSPYISVESYWRAVCRRPCSTFLRRSSLLSPLPSLSLPSLVPGRYLSTMRWKRSDRAGKQKTNRTGRTMNTLWTLFSTVLANPQIPSPPDMIAYWILCALWILFSVSSGPMNSILHPLIFRLLSLLILFSFFPRRMVQIIKHIDL